MSQETRTPSKLGLKIANMQSPLSPALQAAARAIAGHDPTSVAPDFTAASQQARRNERLSAIAGSLTGGMIAQRSGQALVTPAEAVALWREVVTELQNSSAPR